jgi:PAS domain S-box-containing protein
MVSVTDPGRRNGFGGLALMRELIEHMPAAVAYMSGPDLVYEIANDEYRRIVGDRELIGRPLREVLPELHQEHVATVRQVMLTGQQLRFREPKSWIRHGDGGVEQIYVDFTYRPVRDPATGVAGVLIHAADVTEYVRDRRMLEELAERLAATEERYRTLFETMPQGVVHYSADGSVIGVNPAAIELLGLSEPMTSWPLARSSSAVHEDGSAYQFDELPVMVALRTGEIVADQVVGTSDERTGALRWFRLTAVPDARDARGRPQRAYVMFADITEQRRAEAALREGNRMLGRLREANSLGVAVVDDNGIEEANDALLDILGYTRDDFEAGRIHWRTITPPEWAASTEDAVRQLRRTGACRPFEKEHIHRDGHRVPVLIGAAVIDWHPLRWATYVVDLTARQRAEQERAALLAGEHEARTEAAVAQDRLAFLLRAGDLVAATSSRDDLLEQVTKLVVPTLADYCVAFEPTTDGKLSATKLTHRDAAKEEVLKLLREHPIPAMGPLISQQAYATASTRLAREFNARTPRWTDAAPGLLRVADHVNPTSALAVPLVVGEQPLGVLLLGRGEGRPLFTETDIALVEELARRLAAGLANADTFAREHTVAETLQHALLPATLPKVEGLDLAVHYLPASDGVHVGGDWYDAFPLGRGRVGLAIGDVAGHSIDSASIMGQIRGLLRGYAIEDAAPQDVLRRTNMAIVKLLPETVATAFYGVLDPVAGDLHYAIAGHPPPLHAGDRGHAEYLDSPAGTMLGVSAGTLFAAGHRRLQAGAGLLLYTDGLVEDRHRDIADGLDMLSAAFERCARQSAQQICQSVQADLLGASPRADDVCILAVRLPGTPSSAGKKHGPMPLGELPARRRLRSARRSPQGRWS